MSDKSALENNMLRVISKSGKAYYLSPVFGEMAEYGLELRRLEALEEGETRPSENNGQSSTSSKEPEILKN